jgi:hypothetical protein
LAEFGLDFTGKDSCVYSFARYLAKLRDRPKAKISKKMSARVDESFSYAA